MRVFEVGVAIDDEVGVACEGSSSEAPPTEVPALLVMAVDGND